MLRNAADRQVVVRIELSITELVHIVELLQTGAKQAATDPQPTEGSVGYLCKKTGITTFYGNPESEHGPCGLQDEVRDHCWCEHATGSPYRVKCERCAERTVPTVLCEHA